MPEPKETLGKHVAIEDPGRLVAVGVEGDAVEDERHSAKSNGEGPVTAISLHLHLLRDLRGDEGKAVFKDFPDGELPGRSGVLRPDMNGVVVVVVDVGVVVNPCNKMVGVGDGGENNVRMFGRSGVFDGQSIDVKGGVKGLLEEVGKEGFEVFGKLADVGGEVDRCFGRCVTISKASGVVVGGLGEEVVVLEVAGNGCADGVLVGQRRRTSSHREEVLREGLEQLGQKWERALGWRTK